MTKPRRSKLTAVQLRKLLRYDPETGVFRWRASRGRRQGDIAGHQRQHPTDRYIIITIDGRSYKASQLAWLWMTGSLPPNGYEVDHKDTDAANNRWRNLRLATRGQNQRNTGMRRNNKTGLKGVCYIAREHKFRAQIRANGKHHALGEYDFAEEAHHAYREAARRLHGKFANLGLIEREWQRRWSWFLCYRDGLEC